MRPAARRWAGFVLLALATHAHPLHQPLQCDLSLFTRYGQDWAAGAVPYVDRYEPKTPAVFALFRLVGAGHPPLTLYLLTAGLVGTAAAELRRTLAREVPAAADAAGLLLVGFSGALPYLHLYGPLLLPFVVLAVAWSGRALVAAGAAFALAVGLFPPAAVCGLAVFSLVWRGGRLRAVAGFTTGVTVVVGLVTAHSVAFGYWAGFVDAMEATRRYAAVTRVTAGEHVTRWAAEVRTLAVAVGPVVLVVAGGGLATLVVGWRRLSGAARRWAAVGGLWLVAAQAGAFAGGRHFTHYYFPLVGPLALLAALGLSGLPLRVRRAAVAGCGAALVAGNWSVHLPGLMAARRLDPDHPRTAVVVAAAYLSSTVPPDEPVLVATWDRWAELYWRVRRPGPSRHVVPFNLAETRPELFAGWAEDVLARPPAWLVTDNSTFGPGVTDAVLAGRAGGFGGPALVGTPAFARLRELVARGYTVHIVAADLVILRRSRP